MIGASTTVAGATAAAAARCVTASAIVLRHENHHLCFSPSHHQRSTNRRRYLLRCVLSTNAKSAQVRRYRRYLAIRCCSTDSQRVEQKEGVEPGVLVSDDDISHITNDGDNGKNSGLNSGWLPVFPHALTASMANFLFGYHIGVMNGPIESIARELRFEGNSFLEGLVVSIFIAGAFIGSISSGSLVDKFGCRRTFQLDTVPLIIGSLLSAHANSLEEMLLGRFLVGLGIGVNTVLVPIYISEVAPTKYRGSLGTLCQIGTCLGIIASLALGIRSEDDPH